MKRDERIQRFEGCTALWIAVALVAAFAAGAVAHSAEPVNLALNKPVVQSSDCSCGRASQAVDGDEQTYWQPLSGDRQDDQRVWMYVDLGAAVPLNQFLVHFQDGHAERVQGYQILYSLDAETWIPVHTRTQGPAIQTIESANLASFTARYVRLDVTLVDPSRNFQLKEFKLFHAAGG